MNEASGNGQQPGKFRISYTEDEVILEIESGPEDFGPPRPVTGKQLENLKAWRAKLARHDPKFRARLESRGIFLTPEELQEPPSPEDAKAPPS